MSATLSIICGPCGYEHIQKNASKWCTNCEEGFCGDCIKMHRATKMSRDHKFISIEDYREISSVNIIQTCKDHDKKFDLYCKVHDSVLCLSCVPIRHMACSANVIPIEEAARNAKTSTALNDLQESIISVLKNIGNLNEDRDRASKNFEEQEQNIRREIADARANINKHLDNIEQTLLLDLSKIYSACRRNHEQNVKYLELTETKIKSLNEQVLQMKQFASDLQVFLGTRQINKTLSETIRSVTSDVQNIQNDTIRFQIHPVIKSLLTDVKSLGQINVENTNANLSFTPPKIDQAQIHVPVVRTVNYVKLELKQTINIKQEGRGMSISGCIILPNGQLLIADVCGKKQLMQYNHDGAHIRDIPVSAQPYDITVIDSNRVAISYGSEKYIEILNINSYKLENKLRIGSICGAISYQEGKLYIVSENVLVTDVSGKMKHIIQVDVSSVLNIATTKDRIYFSDYVSDEILCFTLTGEKLWKFRDDSVKTPRGLAIDSNQNVFVVGKHSNNVTIISHDGRTSKTLLTSSDELQLPLAICYSTVQRTLLVCNEGNGKTNLYNVT